MRFEDKNFIAEQIKLYRKKAGMTQEQLAEKVNLSTQHISRIESGCYIPSLNSFFMIVKALKMDLKAFGYNAEETENEHKNSLIQAIASASEMELIFYEKVLSAVKESFEKMKNNFFNY